MKKIFIYAYLNKNLGDDLFIKILCNKFKKHKFYMLCSKHNAQAFLEIPNLTVISFSTIPNKVFSKINRNITLNKTISRLISKRMDATINIGGSIFMEAPGWQKKIEHYEKDIKYSQEFFVLGANFGPFVNENYYRRYSNLFRNVKDICFRDTASYDLFSDLPNVRMAPDIVFSMDRKIDLIEKTNTIIFSVLDLEKRNNLSEYKDSYELKIVELSKAFIDRGYEVIYMSFCEREGDEVAINRIFDSMPEVYKNKASKYFYDGNLSESIHLIEKASGFITTRFHSLILAWLSKIPVYPLIYSNKITNIINDTNFEGDYAEIKDISNLKVETVISQIEKGTIHRIDEQIEFANEQFTALENSLG